MKNEQIPAGKLEEWKSKHGDVFSLQIEELELDIVVRGPSDTDMARFARRAPKDLMKATRNLVVDCTLHPDPSTLVSVFERKPGVVLVIGAKLQDIAGSNIEVDLGKL